jgi:hypothetical protein
MKKKLFTLSIALGMMLAFPSCASQMERDATKMAKRAIEFEQTTKRMEDRSNLGGKRMSEQEYDQYARDYIEFANQLHKKYSQTPEEQERFYQLVEKKRNELKGDAF